MIQIKKASITLLPILLLSINKCDAQIINIYNNGRQIFPSPNFEEEPKSLFATTDEEDKRLYNIASSSPVFLLAQQGLKKFDEANYYDAREIFKSALRLEPNNPTLWKLYEDSVIRDYNRAKINEANLSSVSETFKPNFAITRTDSYIELGTLYIVGTIKNISDTRKQKINLKARLFDKNNKEIRTSLGTLRSVYKSLRPNETSIFEIPIKNPPSKIDSYRVEVSSWED